MLRSPRIAPARSFRSFRSDMGAFGRSAGTLPAATRLWPPCPARPQATSSSRLRPSSRWLPHPHPPGADSGMALDRGRALGRAWARSPGQARVSDRGCMESAWERPRPRMESAWAGRRPHPLGLAGSELRRGKEPAVTRTERVIVGVSGTPGNLPALRYALDLARREDAMLVAVIAWIPPGGDYAERRAPSPELRKPWARAAAGRLTEALRLAWGSPDPDGPTVRTVVRRGEPGPMLLR